MQKCNITRKMARHNILGKSGEDYAVAYLKKKGYIIRHRNWRCGKKELDIIAQLNGELIVVEVKTRRSVEFGDPTEAITDRKIRNIVSSTDAYLRKYCLDIPVRFDVITLIGDEEHFTIEHICEAFFPPIW